MFNTVVLKTSFMFAAVLTISLGAMDSVDNTHSRENLDQALCAVVAQRDLAPDVQRDRIIKWVNR